MIDPDEPIEVRLVRQDRIIAALLRRAEREHSEGSSAFDSFQSAVALQARVWAKTRDLERANSALTSARHDRERERRGLAEALAVMESGFALFADGRLELCNPLFAGLVPDLADAIGPGLTLDAYVAGLLASPHLTGADGRLRSTIAQVRQHRPGTAVAPVVIGLAGDRHVQLGFQRTASGAIVVLVAEITAIVRQARAEQASLIDRQADYLQAAFETMPSGLCTFGADFTLRMSNSCLRSMLGLSLTLTQPGTPLERLIDHLRGSMRPGEGGEPARWLHKLARRGRLHRQLHHASGRVLDLRVHRLPDGGYLANLTDITAKVRAAEALEVRVAARTAELTEANAILTRQYEEMARVKDELRDAKERAEAAVSSKTRFLAAASHDLLQPVNAAKLLVSTLCERVSGTSLDRLADRLRGSLASTEQLLRSLLDISRLERVETDLLERSDVGLGPLIQSVLEDQEPVAAAKGVRLDAAPCSAVVRSDAGYLLRSIQNLVVNAIQYTPPGGRVLVGCRQRGAEVRLEVWDTGIGISIKDQRRIFEEFTRADSAPPGTGVGLGLSIVERACRHLGHRIELRSKPGVGSVFSITMERSAVQALAPQSHAPDITSSADATGLIALVVENDPAVLDAMVTALESWGASVLGATGTADALALVRDIGIAPDIVVADWQLDGGESGLDAIEAVRALAGSPVPALLVTADPRREPRELAARANVPVLAKPVDPLGLRAAIARMTGALPGLAAAERSAAFEDGPPGDMWEREIWDDGGWEGSKPDRTIWMSGLRPHSH